MDAGDVKDLVVACFDSVVNVMQKNERVKGHPKILCMRGLGNGITKDLNR